MTLSDRIFATIWFLIGIPILLIGFPTLHTGIAILVISGIFLAQLIMKFVWRCPECGHKIRITDTRLMGLVAGELTCHHCQAVTPVSRSLKRKFS